jgi:hypothetical protein
MGELASRVCDGKDLSPIRETGGDGVPVEDEVSDRVDKEETLPTGGH